MPFPLIPIIAGIAIVTGGGTLYWYSSQTKEKRQKADQAAADWCKDVAKKAPEMQSSEEAKLALKIARVAIA